MVRPYAVKGKKRKKREEKYDKEEVEDEADEQPPETVKRGKTSNGEEQEEEEGEGEAIAKVADTELEGIPLAPSDQTDVNKAGVIFILEKASLEVAKVGKVQSYCYCLRRFFID